MFSIVPCSLYSPCSPCSPKLLHVLPFRVAGRNNFKSPGDVSIFSTKWKVHRWLGKFTNKMTDVKQKLQYVCSQPWSFVKVTAKFQLKCPVKGSRVYTKMQNMKSIEHFWQRYLVQAKRNFGLKTILHKECFAMVGNVHFKLGFIDKLV